MRFPKLGRLLSWLDLSTARTPLTAVVVSPFTLRCRSGVAERDARAVDGPTNSDVVELGDTRVGGPNHGRTRWAR